MIITITGKFRGTGRTATGVNIARRLFNQEWIDLPIDRVPYLHEKDLRAFPISQLPQYSIVSDIDITDKTIELNDILHLSHNEFVKAIKNKIILIDFPYPYYESRHKILNLQRDNAYTLMSIAKHSRKETIVIVVLAHSIEKFTFGNMPIPDITNYLYSINRYDQSQTKVIINQIKIEREPTEIDISSEFSNYNTMQIITDPNAMKHKP